MMIGPVQLLVLGFHRPDFHGEIRAELARLRDNDLIRVLDALAVAKDADGVVTIAEGSQLSADEAEEFGSMIGALIGLGAGGQRGMEIGARLGARAVRRRGGGVLGDDQVWDVLAEIPDDTAAALILLEHRWAIPLRDAVTRANGFRVTSAFISPADLIELGLLTAKEAEAVAATDGDVV